MKKSLLLVALLGLAAYGCGPDDDDRKNRQEESEKDLAKKQQEEERKKQEQERKNQKNNPKKNNPKKNNPAPKNIDLTGIWQINLKDNSQSYLSFKKGRDGKLVMSSIRVFYDGAANVTAVAQSPITVKGNSVRIDKDHTDAVASALTPVIIHAELKAGDYKFSLAKDGTLTTNYPGVSSLARTPLGPYKLTGQGVVWYFATNSVTKIVTCKTKKGDEFQAVATVPSNYVGKRLIVRKNATVVTSKDGTKCRAKISMGEYKLAFRSGSYKKTQFTFPSGLKLNLDKVPVVEPFVSVTPKSGKTMTDADGNTPEGHEPTPPVKKDPKLVKRKMPFADGGTGKGGANPPPVEPNNPGNKGDNNKGGMKNPPATGKEKPTGNENRDNKGGKKNPPPVTTNNKDDQGDKKEPEKEKEPKKDDKPAQARQDITGIWQYAATDDDQHYVGITKDKNGKYSFTMIHVARDGKSNLIARFNSSATVRGAKVHIDQGGSGLTWNDDKPPMIVDVDMRAGDYDFKIGKFGVTMTTDYPGVGRLTRAPLGQFKVDGKDHITWFFATNSVTKAVTCKTPSGKSFTVFASAPALLVESRLEVLDDAVNKVTKEKTTCIAAVKKGEHRVIFSGGVDKIIYSDTKGGKWDLTRSTEQPIVVKPQVPATNKN